MQEAETDVMDSRLAGDVQNHNFDVDMTKRVLRNTRKKPIWYYTKDTTLHRQFTYGVLDRQTKRYETVPIVDGEL